MGTNARAADVGLRPAERVQHVTAYRPGAGGGVPPRLRLDRNEGPAPVDLWRQLGRDDEGVDGARRYPSVAALELFLAERHGVAPEQVLVTAGVDDALGRLCFAMLEPGRSLVAAEPTFEMLPRYARLAGGRFMGVPWWDGPYPLDAVRAACTEETRLVMLVSPNNPTGLAATSADLRGLAEKLPQGLVVLDGAYEEFAVEPLTDVALRLSNAVVVRTLSKAWGLAGLRVGYALGPAHVLEWLRVVGHPYAVAGWSAAAALRWLQVGQPRVDAYVANVRRERGELAKVLAASGAAPTASQANFVFARHARAGEIAAGLRRLGIAIRTFGDTGPLADALRITLPGNEAEFEELCDGLRAAVAGLVERDK